jgi:hypothetical protein
VGPASERAGRIAAALARRPEPARVLALARAHAVVALVAERLPPAALTPEWDELLAEARSIGYRNVYLAGELVSLVRRLVAAGLDVMAFKGPTLAIAAYGSLGARRFVDLDLLVRRRDFAAACAILAEGGFHRRRDDWSAVRHLSHEMTFDGRDGRVEVDLHRRLFSRELVAVDLPATWTAAAAVRIGDLEVPTLDDVTTTLALAEHGHKHGWSRLLWIADLAHWIAGRDRLDWDLVTARAGRTGSARVLAVGASLAERLLALGLPPPVARLRSDPVARRLVERCERRLFEPPASGFAAKLELGALQWHGRERWRERLRYALTPNEDDWRVLPLPGALFAAYYLIRPLRLLGTYGAGLLRRPSAGGAGAD